MKKQVLTEEQKEAKRLYNKERYKNNPDKIKEATKKWAKANPVKAKEASKRWAKANPSKAKEATKKWAKANPEYVKNYNKEYNKNNSEKIKANKKITGKIYAKNNRTIINAKLKERRKNDLVFRLTCNLRSLIGKAFKNKGIKKNNKTSEILGCQINDFKKYLEAKFLPWMNWQNYGLYDGTPNYGWDIDHIVAVSNSVTEEDVIKLNHHTNLQPLCSYNNRVIKRNA